MPARRLFLASSSPRRRRLIEALDLTVELVSPDGEEDRPLPGETPREFVCRMAIEKARGVACQTEDCIVLAADTTVVLESEVLGKPADGAEAARMLGKLRGRVHTVLTGVAALDRLSGRQVWSVKATDVTMRRYSDEEVAAYVVSGEPLDKAGAYAVQDQVFSPALEMVGCYLNVVGLPICDVVELLKVLGVEAKLRPDWTPPEQCGECPLRGMVEVNRE